jgi:hypothetical protein
MEPTSKAADALMLSVMRGGRVFRHDDRLTSSYSNAALPMRGRLASISQKFSSHKVKL